MTKYLIILLFSISISCNGQKILFFGQCSPVPSGGGSNQLSTPTNGTITGIDSVHLTANVSNVDTHATYLSLDYKLTSSGTWTNYSSTLARTVTSQVLSGLTKASDYNVRWTAVGTSGYISANSSVQNATTWGGYIRVGGINTNTGGDTAHIHFPRNLQSNPSISGLSFIHRAIKSSSNAINPTRLDVTFYTPYPVDTTITCSYSPGTILADDAGILPAFSNHAVTNYSTVTASSNMTFSSAATNSTGTYLDITCSKNVASCTSGITLYVGGSSKTFAYSIATYKIRLTPTVAFVYGDAITVTASSSNAVATDASTLTNFSGQYVTNNVPNSSNNTNVFDWNSVGSYPNTTSFNADPIISNTQGTPNFSVYPGSLGWGTNQSYSGNSEITSSKERTSGQYSLHLVVNPTYPTVVDNGGQTCYTNCRAEIYWGAFSAWIPLGTEIWTKWSVFYPYLSSILDQSTFSVSNASECVVRQWGPLGSESGPQIALLLNPGYHNSSIAGNNIFLDNQAV